MCRSLIDRFEGIQWFRKLKFEGNMKQRKYYNITLRHYVTKQVLRFDACYKDFVSNET